MFGIDDALLGSLISGGLGLAGSLLGGNKEGGTESGYDVVTMPQYSFTEPRNRLVSDYLTQNIERMSRGEYPSWYSKAQPVMREGMIRGLNQSYYGRPGERTGLMQQATDLGAITGIGPKATWAQNRKLQTSYLDKAQAIDEYLTTLGANVMQQGEQTYLNTSNQMPKGPDATIVPMGSQSYGNQSQSPWLSLGSSLAGMLGSGGFGNLFGGGSSGGGLQSFSQLSNAGMASTGPAYYNTYHYANK